MPTRLVGDARRLIRNNISSLNLNGSNAYATLPISPSPSGFNLSFWYKSKIQLPGSNEALFNWHEAGPTANGIRAYRSTSARNRITFSMFNGTTDTVNASVNGIPFHDWFHITITFSGTTFKVYVNAELVLTDTSASFVAPTGQNFTLGKLSSSGANYLSGYLSELCFENNVVAWTQDQIDDLYFRGIAPDGADALYRFDGNINDFSGNENTGTLYNTTFSLDAPATPRLNIQNNIVALEFGGGSETDNVNCSKSESLELIGEYSLAFRMYPRSLGGGNAGRVLNKNGTLNVALTQNSSNAGYGSLAIGNAGSTKISASNTYRLNAWSDVVITYDQTNLLVYINGNLVETIPQTVDPVATTSVDLLIGNATSPSLTRAFDGYLDDITLFKGRVLTANEVWDFSKRRNLSTENLSLLLKFNEGSGSTTEDSSGNENTGVISGATYVTL